MEFTSYLNLALKELAFGFVIPIYIFFKDGFKLAEKYPKYETLIICLAILLFALFRYPIYYLCNWLLSF